MREVPGGAFAAAVFRGEATEATSARQKEELCARLRADGAAFEDAEWSLARYNDPSTKPDKRRNEVLVRLKDFNIWDT